MLSSARPATGVFFESFSFGRLLEPIPEGGCERRAGQPVPGRGGPVTDLLRSEF